MSITNPTRLMAENTNFKPEFRGTSIFIPVFEPNKIDLLEAFQAISNGTKRLFRYSLAPSSVVSFRC